MAETTVGRFTYNATTGAVTGPEAYMRERFPTCRAEIESGRNVAFNYGAAGASPNIETALLVAIQTDYAGWHGARTLGVTA